MKKRVMYLDFLRCIAICFVIILHVMTPFLPSPGLYGSRAWWFCLLQNPINRTGVPLFFMISGYLMLKNPGTRDIGGFYKKHFPRILIPLAIWNAVYYLGQARTAKTVPSLSKCLSALFVNGSSYHFWFIYTLIGIYLLTPFLKRIVDACSTKELAVFFLIVIFPGAIRPMINLSLPVYIKLFEPVVESYVGYFLMGYLLGSQTLGRKARILFYLGGLLGYFIGVYGNYAEASAESIPLTYNTGYYLNHYLCAAALFVLAKALFERWQDKLSWAEAPLAKLSDIIFGVYWVHVLVLNRVAARLGGEMPLLRLMLLEIVLTTAISYAAALVLSYIPVLRKCLM